MSLPIIPGNLGNKVSTRTYDWRSMVIDNWGEEWKKRDIVYEFSNGEKRQSTDATNTGIYNGGAT